MITELRRLWRQAFGDPEAFLDVFFATAYSPDRCRYLTEDGQVTAALYWFDCTCRGNKLAYLYAVATDAAFRGQGLCRQLMEQTHAELRQQGYAGAVLVPGSEDLFRLYEKLGYRTFGSVEEFTCGAGVPVALQPISTEKYAALRRQYLPAGGVVQEGASLALLATQAQFYAGDGFVLAAVKDAEKLTVHELLGSGDAPGIVAALDAAEGHFRTPGKGKPFAMFYTLTKCPAPAYLGIALD